MPIHDLELLTIIKDIRIKKKISTTRIAQKVGVSQGHYSNIESGRTRCSLPVFLKILNALKIDIVLLAETSDMATPKIALTDKEAKALAEFRNLPDKKQDAVLSLLKDSSKLVEAFLKS